VIDRDCRGIASFPQTFLTEAFIPFQNERTQPVPLAAVASLVAVKTALVLLPAFIAVRFTIPGSID